MKRGFIAYDPVLAVEKFNGDMVVTIYYLKLLRYEQILSKDDEGFFTRSIRDIEKATCIKRRQQESARKWLERQGYITSALKVPTGKTAPQLHFKIVDMKRLL